MRLIDANIVKSAVMEVMAENRSEELFIKIGALICKMLDHANTVYAVPVVRCKDCKQWRRNIGFTDNPNGHCFYHDIDANGFDFCSYGERRVSDV